MLGGGNGFYAAAIRHDLWRRDGSVASLMATPVGIRRSRAARSWSWRASRRHGAGARRERSWCLTPPLRGHRAGVPHLAGESSCRRRFAVMMRTLRRRVNGGRYRRNWDPAPQARSRRVITIRAMPADRRKSPRNGPTPFVVPPFSRWSRSTPMPGDHHPPLTDECGPRPEYPQRRQPRSAASPMLDANARVFKRVNFPLSDHTTTTAGYGGAPAPGRRDDRRELVDRALHDRSPPDWPSWFPSPTVGSGIACWRYLGRLRQICAGPADPMRALPVNAGEAAVAVAAFASAGAAHWPCRQEVPIDVNSGRGDFEKQRYRTATGGAGSLRERQLWPSWRARHLRSHVRGSFLAPRVSCCSEALAFA